MAPHTSSHPCSLCVRLLKWVPVLFIMAIVVWSYFAYVIQLNILTIESIPKKVIYLLVYHTLLVLFLASYYQTVFMPPTKIPKQFRLAPHDVETYEVAATDEARRAVLETLVERRGLPVANRTVSGEVRYCERCKHVKPDRCHHCSVCGECVAKMDHHCPWVNNCVSFANYKCFVLFLSYSFLYCVWIAVTTLEYLLLFWRTDMKGAGKFHILFVFFVCIMFAISLVSLLGYHIWLTLKNRSTIESFRAPIFHVGHAWAWDKDGFSLGTYQNFLEVFGDDWRWWALPVFTSLGDGVTYPQRCLDEDQGQLLSAAEEGGWGELQPAYQGGDELQEVVVNSTHRV